ncbi:MAG: hypothetical protein ACRD12_03110 [Acidimicrobiales bacterium]
MPVSLTDPTVLRTLVEDATGVAGQLKASAPGGARAAVESLSTTLAALRSALDAADYELAKLPPNLVTRMQSPVVADAISALEAAVAKAC